MKSKKPHERTERPKYRIGQVVHTEGGKARITGRKFYKGRWFRHETKGLVRSNRGWYYHFTVIEKNEITSVPGTIYKIGEKTADWEELIGLYRGVNCRPLTSNFTFESPSGGGKVTVRAFVEEQARKEKLVEALVEAEFSIAEARKQAKVAKLLLVE